MKIKRLHEIRYNGVNNTIVLSGENSIGKKSDVEIAIGNAAYFLGMMNTALLSSPDFNSGYRLSAVKIDVVTVNASFAIMISMQSLDVEYSFLTPTIYPTSTLADEKAEILRNAFEALLSPGKSAAN